MIFQLPKSNFLGFYLTLILTLKLHIKSISSKISNSLFHLRAAKNILSQKALTMLYYSLIHSHLIYAIHIWSSTSSSNFRELVTKQKMAICIIHKSSYDAHTESLFKKSAILPLPSLMDYFKIQFMHSHTFKYLPTSSREAWIKKSERREDQDQPLLRNENDYYSGRGKFIPREKFMPPHFGHWLEALKIVIGAQFF